MFGIIEEPNHYEYFCFSLLLSFLSGRQKALRVLATSARIDSAEAINLGLIDGIIDEFPLKNEVNLSRTKF